MRRAGKRTTVRQLIGPPPLSENVAKLRQGLVKAGGNITRAAEKLGVSKPWLMALLRRHDLNEYARKLRLQNGQAFTGRPRILHPPPPLETTPPDISQQSP